ncbi:MAG: tRNA (adenosine(37)-N6)-threonylcarbamoyltransferase complex dimerization subunit type 1 TsaB [Saprospiraceae bacterium]|jgi:tRNA threonylcarbamoyladenosine biosynthesis protein TsaB|nr:tRNA (adenosine(37)-N6)-threonylcarbamoyltransferase complex dimerization subunit type 1 TsaB [Saprospiraceae bacterium]
MALILSIESATDHCSVCVSEKEEVLAYKAAEEKFQHGQQLTLFIQSVLKSAQLSLKDMDAIAISGGPGSYTALRIGTATAKGICFALDKPLIAIPSLQALALQAARLKPDAKHFCSMIDARRMEVYTATYDYLLDEKEVAKALIVTADAFDHLEGDIVFCGNGAEKCKTVLQKPNSHFLTFGCDARYLAPLAFKAFQGSKFEHLAYYAPFYLKPPNITTPKKRL